MATEQGEMTGLRIHTETFIRTTDKFKQKWFTILKNASTEEEIEDRVWTFSQVAELCYMVRRITEATNMRIYILKLLIIMIYGAEM